MKNKRKYNYEEEERYSKFIGFTSILVIPLFLILSFYLADISIFLSIIFIIAAVVNSWVHVENNMAIVRKRK